MKRILIEQVDDFIFVWAYGRRLRIGSFVFPVVVFVVLIDIDFPEGGIGSVFCHLITKID